MFYYSLIVFFLGISSVSSQQAQDDDLIPEYSPVLVRQVGYYNYETSSSYAAAIAAALEIEEKTEEKTIEVETMDVEITE